MTLRVVQRHLHDGAVDVSGMLAESMAELGEAVADLRRLAQRIRPSCLDDGLQPALCYLVDSMPPATPVDHTDDDARVARTLRVEMPSLPVVLLSQKIETRHSIELVSSGFVGDRRHDPRARRAPTPREDPRHPKIPFRSRRPQPGHRRARGP
jgi:hypothetical protein